MHKHRCHESAKTHTGPVRISFQHCGIFSKLFNMINSIHRVQVSSKKVRERRSKMKRRKKKALTVFTGHEIVSWTINQDGLTGGVHPLQQSQSEGFAGSVWNDSTSLCWSKGQWRSTQLSQRPQRTAKLFISTTTPAHIHHDQESFQTLSDVFQDPWREKPCVCVCVCVYGTVSSFLKQCKCEFF